MGNGEEAVQVRFRENGKKDQSLDSTTNKSVENCIRLTETSSRTGEDDDRRGRKL